MAKKIGDLTSAFRPDDRSQMIALEQVLRRYAEVLEPWAESVADRVVGEVDRQDARAWRQRTKAMSTAMRQEVQSADTGSRMRQLMAEQVRLIKSIPVEAAERVHRLTIEGLQGGTRAAEVAKEIMASGNVAESLAKLIARTEVGRAKTTLTQARAEHVGSEGYIWRTSKDTDVRHSHKKMEGKFVRWDTPPTLDGLTGHAGALPNCRCYPEPVIPED